jgi:hypothetical protein
VVVRFFFVNISGLVDHHCLMLSICLGFLHNEEKKTFSEQLQIPIKKIVKKKKSKILAW